jgi:hypothetical protein
VRRLAKVGKEGNINIARNGKWFLVPDMMISITVRHSIGYILAGIRCISAEPVRPTTMHDLTGTSALPRTNGTIKEIK